MRARRAKALRPAPDRLDRLLAVALVCARRLGSTRMTEAIVCALEVHAEETGSSAALDAAYLRCVGYRRRAAVRQGRWAAATALRCRGRR